MQDFHRSRGVDIRLGARLAAIEGGAKVSQVKLVRRRRTARRSRAARRRRQAERRSRGRGGPRLRGRHRGRRARPHRRSGDLGGGRLHALPEQALRPQAAARMRAERDRPGQGGRVRAARQAASLRSGAVVLVGSVRAEAADGRAQRGLRRRARPSAMSRPRRFSVEYRRNGKLIAVDAVNDGRAYMSGRKRIAEETA